ncbi:MAG: hypothetical protein M3417_08520 [Actinomycetota bacterium]|nr:hypothetical protein [Actinomycetota bacterium]
MRECDSVGAPRDQVSDDYTADADQLLRFTEPVDESAAGTPEIHGV